MVTPPAPPPMVPDEGVSPEANYNTAPVVACQGKHIHTYSGGDLGEEMSHVWGAVVVRRPDLAEAAGALAPAHALDFVKTLQSYFPTSRDSLLRYIRLCVLQKRREAPCLLLI